MTREEMHQSAVEKGVHRLIDLLEWYIPTTRDEILRRVIEHYEALNG